MFWENQIAGMSVGAEHLVVAGILSKGLLEILCWASPVVHGSLLSEMNLLQFEMHTEVALEALCPKALNEDSLAMARSPAEAEVIGRLIVILTAYIQVEDIVNQEVHLEPPKLRRGYPAAAFSDSSDLKVVAGKYHLTYDFDLAVEKRGVEESLVKP